jgi:hypothetical protein
MRHPGLPALVVDSQPRSAWFSRYVARRLSWEESMEGSESAAFLLELGQIAYSMLDFRDPLPALGDLAVLVWRVAHKTRYKEAYA